MTLEELLRSAARDVADRAPDTDVTPSGIRSRARQVRRRRRVGLVAGVVVSTALVAIGFQAVGGSKAGPEPVRPSTPSPTASTDPGSPIVTVPEFTSDDIRRYEELVTMTNTQPDNLGLTELTFEVTLRDRYVYEVSHFCSGDRDTWVVYMISDGGGSGSGYCNDPVPDPFPALPTDISPFGHSDDNPKTVTVRMFVTGPIPQQHLDCFEQRSPPECRNVEPRLEPLASTDVTFGISVYEHWAPAVAEWVGQGISALASVEGDDFTLSQLLEPGAGQTSLATTLEAADGDRLVAVLQTLTDAGIDCLKAAERRKDQEKCYAIPELRIGDRVVPLVRGEFGDYPSVTLGHPMFRVSGDRDLQVEVRVASGDPANVGLRHGRVRGGLLGVS